VARNDTPKGKHKDAGLIAALAAGASVPAAAAHARCSERTVYRKLADPEFKRRVTEARAEMVRQAIGQLASVGVLAGQELQRLLSNDKPTVRLGAARSIYEYMFRGAEVDLLARQLAELKERLEEIERAENPGQRSGEAPRPPGPPTAA
jgi:hypothetical protein